MLAVFTNCLILICLYAGAWFIISLFYKRNDIADIAWGAGYILICVYLYFTQEVYPVLLLLFILILLWGMRLSIHIYNRNRKKSEDFRYKAWREAWGKSFYIRSFLQVYVFQALLLLLIISPVIHAAVSAPVTLGIFTWLGLSIWLPGFYFQAVSDYQLSEFTRKRTPEQKIMKAGLWKYSRHPNYFGEILMWWGIFIITLPVENSWYFIFSPLLITFLLVFVSGIPLLEKKYKGDPEFEEYKKQTSVLFPLPPRNAEEPG